MICSISAAIPCPTTSWTSRAIWRRSATSACSRAPPSSRRAQRQLLLAGGRAADQPREGDAQRPDPERDLLGSWTRLTAIGRQRQLRARSPPTCMPPSARPRTRTRSPRTASARGRRALHEHDRDEHDDADQRQRHVPPVRPDEERADHDGGEGGIAERERIGRIGERGDDRDDERDPQHQPRICSVCDESRTTPVDTGRYIRPRAAHPHAGVGGAQTARQARRLR